MILNKTKQKNPDIMRRNFSSKKGKNVLNLRWTLKLKNLTPDIELLLDHITEKWSLYSKNYLTEL